MADIDEENEAEQLQIMEEKVDLLLAEGEATYDENGDTPLVLAAKRHMFRIVAMIEKRHMHVQQDLLKIIASSTETGGSD